MGDQGESSPLDRQTSWNDGTNQAKTDDDVELTTNADKETSRLRPHEREDVLYDSNPANPSRVRATSYRGEIATMTLDENETKVEKMLQVGVQVCVRRLHNVDTVGEKFDCALTIHNWWHVDDDTHQFYTRDDVATSWTTMSVHTPGEWKPNYFPRLHISNNLGCEWSDAQFTYRPNERRVYRVLDIRCTIKASFRFANFPFDMQVLPIKVSLKHDCSQFELVPFDYGSSTHHSKPIAVLNKKKIVFADFTFFDNVNANKTEQTSENGEKQINMKIPEFAIIRRVTMDKEQGIRESMSQVGLFIPLQRRSVFYLLNHFGICSIITTMVLATWSLDIEQVDARYDLSFTLFLTAVALKLVQADLIPRVSYLTYLDVYTFTNFMLILLAVVFHYTASYFNDVDNTLRYIFVGVWVFGNFLFALSCLRVRESNWNDYFGIVSKYLNSSEVWFFQTVDEKKRPGKRQSILPH